jgi:hypothetical protein
MWDGVLALDFLRRDCLIRENGVITAQTPLQLFGANAARFAVWYNGADTFNSRLLFGEGADLYIPMTATTTGRTTLILSEHVGQLIHYPVWAQSLGATAVLITCLSLEYSARSMALYEEMYREFFSKSYTP